MQLRMRLNGAALRAAMLAFLLANVPASWAHKVHVFAVGEGKSISGYAYFSGGSRVRRMPVKVFTTDGRVVGETTTDDKGEFRFEIPGPADYRLVLETPDGHRAETTVPADDFAPEEEDRPAPAPPAPGPGGKTAAASSVRTAPAPERCLQEAELEKVIDHCLTRRLRTIEERLDRYEQKVRLHDVIGGIGYIFGVFGLLALVQSKRTRSAASPPGE